MKGKAPNCSAMGSQTRVRKKLKPNLWRGSADWRQSSNTRRTVTSTTEAANRKVMTRAISSALRRLETNERETPTGPALGKFVLVADTLLNLAQGLGFFRDYFRWKLGVGEGLGRILPIGKHPLDKIFEGIAFTGVGKFARNEQPGKAGDWVGGLAGSIGNRHAEIVRHGFDGARCGRAHACEIRSDEVARRVLHFPVGHLVLDGINEFDVTDGIGGLLDETSNALIAFAAQADWPVHGCAFADFIFPIAVDLREVIRPDVGGSGAAGAMDDADIG